MRSMLCSEEGALLEDRTNRATMRNYSHRILQNLIPSILLVTLSACQSAGNDNFAIESQYDLLQAPETPKGLYQGPYGRLPSCSAFHKTIQRQGRYVPYDPPVAYPRSYDIEFQNRIYYAQTNPEGFDIYLSGTSRLHPNGRAFFSLNCYDFMGPTVWWASIKASDQKQTCHFYMGLLGSNNRKYYSNLPPGTVLYQWTCYSRQRNVVLNDWFEILLPTGEVKHPSPDQGHAYVSAPEQQCWICDPSLIPAEAKLNNDPFLEWFIKNARNQQ